MYNIQTKPPVTPAVRPSSVIQNIAQPITTPKDMKSVETQVVSDEFPESSSSEEDFNLTNDPADHESSDDDIMDDKE